MRPRRSSTGATNYADDYISGEDDGTGFSAVSPHREVDSEQYGTRARRSSRAPQPSKKYSGDEELYGMDDGVESGEHGAIESDDSDQQVQIKRRTSKRRSHENGGAYSGAPQEVDDERFARKLQDEENLRARRPTVTRLKLKLKGPEVQNVSPRKRAPSDYRDAGLVQPPVDNSDDEDEKEEETPIQRKTRPRRTRAAASSADGPGMRFDAEADGGESEYEVEEEVEDEDDIIEGAVPEDEIMVDEEDVDEDEDADDSDYAGKVETRSGSRLGRRSTRSSGGYRKSRPQRSSKRRSGARNSPAVDYIGRKRARKQTERFSDVLMQSEEKKRRARRGEGSGSGRGKGGGADQTKPRPRPSLEDDDDDVDVDDSSDSSDSSDFDADAIAAAGAGDAEPDFAQNPMADAPRARPSRYVKKRSRTSGLFPDGPAGPPRSRKSGPAPAGIEPIQVDLNLSWDDIGGLDHHVRALKEMVFLPLLYPEVFEKFKMEPPKGVLFYGPPGTGKTLCARALAASCGAAPVDASSGAAGSTPPVAGSTQRSPNDAVEPSSASLLPTGEFAAQTAANGVGKEGTGGVTVTRNGDARSGEARDVEMSAAPREANGDVRESAPDRSAEAALKSAGQSGKEVADGTTATFEPSGVPSAKPTVEPLGNNDAGGALPKVEVAADVGAGSVPAGPMSVPNVVSGSVPSAPASAVGTKPKPRVAFFMRNGADCLSKWVGEAERQLRMTFEAAKKHAPSIIFFDEIDGLAPVRSARQDQIHSSIVSTLLGLMDGLDGRGQIVVIGATNRVDSVDPALRRPGRFDRELIFTLPNGVARRKILDIHTSHWKPKPPPSDILDAVASKTVGYCGADLRALCSESALRALRRRYPQIYGSSDKLLIDVNQVEVRTRDFISAMKEIVPASHRSARTHARPIPARLLPLLESWLNQCVELLKRVFPQGLTPELKSRLVSSKDGQGNTAAIDFDDDDASDWSSDDSEANAVGKAMDIDISRAGKERVVHGRGGMDRPVLRPRVLLCGRGGLGQEQLGPALLHFLEGCPVHSIDLPSLFADGGSRSAEESLVTAVREACRAVPSVLYLPHLGAWWETATDVLRTTLNIALRDIPAELPLLILATAEKSANELPSEVPALFGELVELEIPSADVRRALFAPICKDAEACPKVTNAVLKRRQARRRAEVLPKAPPPPPKVQSPEEVARTEREDDMYIRELRMEMRAFVERIRGDRRFLEFRDAVDPSVVSDYYDLIKDPMWIGKIAEQVDKGMYPTVLAMVKDFDTLVQNVIDYNPPTQEHGAYLLRRAHCLIDVVHSWVDKLDPELVERCNAIVTARLARVRLEATKSAADAAAAVTLPSATAAVVGQTASADVVQEAAVPALAPVIDPQGTSNGEKEALNHVEGVANGPVESGKQSDHRSDEGIGGSNATVPMDISKDGDGKDKPGVLQDVAMPKEVSWGNENVGKEPEMKEKSMEPGISSRPNDLAEPEEPFIPATADDIENLGNTWLDVTSGLNVDSLDVLFTRCSSVLYDWRRSRNRLAAVKELTKILEAAVDDPALPLGF